MMIPRPRHVFTSRSAQRGRARGGAATVELALTLPIVLVVLVGGIEFTRACQVANACAFSAYEGCRAAIIPGGTASAATSAAQQFLTANSIGSSTITVTPSVIDDTTSTVTVNIAVKLDKSGWIAPIFTSGISVSRSCTLTREKTNGT